MDNQLNLEDINTTNVGTIPTETLVHLMNMLECEYVNRLAATAGYKEEDAIE